MHGFKLSLNTGEVWPLARVLLPAILHDPVHVIGTAVGRIHSVALVDVLRDIFYWLQRRGKGEWRDYEFGGNMEAKWELNRLCPLRGGTTGCDFDDSAFILS